MYRLYTNANRQICSLVLEVDNTVGIGNVSDFLRGQKMCVLQKTQNFLQRSLKMKNISGNHFVMN